MINRALSYQKQYNLHQDKIQKNLRSFSIQHWKIEKENFLSLVNYYLSRAKVEKNDVIP